MAASPQPQNPLMQALEQFEASEANLKKLERLSSELQRLIPEGIVFGSNPDFESLARSYSAILAVLPKIDGWKPTAEPLHPNEIAQSRLDASELGEPSAQFAVEKSFEEPASQLRAYRYKFDTMRRVLVRDAVDEVAELIAEDLRIIQDTVEGLEDHVRLEGELLVNLRTHIAQVSVLIGSSVAKPALWSTLQRHLHFGCVCDINDIEQHDWPAVLADLRISLYGENDPLPVATQDLSELVAAKPRGQIVTELAWANLSDSQFERLLYRLISEAPNYENPEWLMQTRAPDRGRDLSVYRIVPDALGDTVRQRVVIQCKHYTTKSVSVQDIASVKEQMALWSDPRVDILIIATSGRFTADAVAWIERFNAGNTLPRVEMWPENRLEKLLAARPALIAEFRLR